MRFLLHTQFYPPEMGAPQARLSDLARRLVQLGHTVEVLTAMPNYPAGKIQQGYGGWYRRDSHQGIPVHRCWIYPSNKPSLVERLASYLSFSFSSLVVGIGRVGKADVVLTESPPIFVAFAGLLIARWKAAKWVMNVSDLWPESAKDVGMFSESSLPYRLLGWLAGVLYRQAWMVTGQSRGIVEGVLRRTPGAKTWHLTNGVDTENFTPGKSDPQIRKRYLANDELGFVYAGLHGLFQGLGQILAVAEKTRDMPVRYLFFGEGPVKGDLQKAAAVSGLKNVSFHPPLPHAEMAALLASMDVSVVTLKTDIGGAVPSKMYEAMACGLPVLLVAGGGGAKIIIDGGSGIAVAPGDGAGFEAAVRRLAADSELRKMMGGAGRLLVTKSYDRAAIANNFAGEVERRMALS